MKNSYLLILFVFGIIIIPSASPTFGQITLGGPVQVIHYQFSDMVSAGNNVYVTYQENSNNGGTSHVFFTRSTDAGRSFTSPIMLDGKTGNSPLMAASGNNVYMAWLSGGVGYPPSSVLFAKSVDDGKTFAAPIVLDANMSANSVVNQLVSDGSNVYALITETGDIPPYDTADYLVTSHNNGTTFGNKVQLLSASGHLMAFDTSLQKVGNTVHITEEDEIGCSDNPNVCSYDILFWKSTDDGATFENPVRIATAINPVGLSVYSSGNNVYAVWDQLAGDEIGLFFAKSNDGGNSFSNPQIIGQKYGESGFPHLVASGKDLYVIWKYDNENIVSKITGFRPPLISGIFLTQSHDGGNTFSEPLDMSGPVGTSYWSNIAASGNSVFVSWGTKFGDKENVFIRKSMDNGTSFDDAVRLTDEKQDYFQKQMALSGRNVYVAIDTALPGDDLFLTASHDYGNTFGTLVSLNHEDLLHLGPPSKVPAVQVYPENSHADDLYNAIILAAVGVPIAIGVSIGMLLFTRKRK
jgi:hypothetical protein